MAVKYYSEFSQLDSRTNTTAVIRVELSNDDYTGSPVELISGADPLRIEYAHTEKMQPIRGSRAVLQYIVNSGQFTAQELYTDDEQYWKVDVYRDGAIIWRGFVIPDGCSEPFMDPPYTVTIQAVDGLALLKEYDFTGVGENTIIEAVSKCLGPISTHLNICVFNGLTFNTQPANTDTLAQLNIEYENFSNPGGDGPLTLYEALESILTSFGMSIQQNKGEWYITRLPDLGIEESLNFYRYDYTGTFIDNFTYNPYLVLGSQEDDLTHCNADQLRRNDFPYKEVKVRYKYGLFNNLLTASQSKFLRGIGPGEFYGWTKGGAINAFPREYESDPYAGIYGKNNPGSNQLRLTDPIAVGAGSAFKLTINFNVGGGDGMAFVVQLVRDSEILYLGENGFSTDYHIQHFLNRRTYAYPGQPSLSIGNKTDATGVIEFNIPDDGGGMLNIHLLEAFFDSGNTSGEGGLTKLYNISLVSLPGGTQIVSDLATVVNAGNYTTKPEPFEIYHGESETDEYIGTIKKLDGSPTNGFKRPDDAGYLPFIQIIAEDIMFMNGRPMAIYSGSVYGFFNFFSVFTIPGLDGIFIAVEASYSLKENITRVELKEIGTTPVPIASSTVEHEYENPVKVNISDA